MGYSVSQLILSFGNSEGSQFEDPLYNMDKSSQLSFLNHLADTGFQSPSVYAAAESTANLVLFTCFFVETFNNYS